MINSVSNANPSFKGFLMAGRVRGKEQRSVWRDFSKCMDRVDPCMIAKLDKKGVDVTMQFTADGSTKFYLEHGDISGKFVVRNNKKMPYAMKITLDDVKKGAERKIEAFVKRMAKYANRAEDYQVNINRAAKNEKLFEKGLMLKGEKLALQTSNKTCVEGEFNTATYYDPRKS